MKAKTLLIPVAAFALSATGASALSTDVLEDAGFTSSQIAAFEEARELRAEGDKDAARDLLVEAGIDLEMLKGVREAVKEDRAAKRSTVKDAIANDDYSAFLNAIEGSPLADIVDTEAEFDQLREAHTLREAGDKDAAREILDELGIEKRDGKHGEARGERQEARTEFRADLSDDQVEAIEEARELREAGDSEGARAVLEDAGVERPEGSRGGDRGPRGDRN